MRSPVLAPFAMIVALTLFVSVLFSTERQRLPINATVVIWLMFIVWMAIATFNAVYPDQAMESYPPLIQIQVMTFLTLILIIDEKKLNLLIWVIVLSVGFFSFKGGIFTLMTGGAFHVFGPTAHIKCLNFSQKHIVVLLTQKCGLLT